MVALVKKIDLAEPLSDGLPVLCDYETVEGAIEMLTLISEVERIAQCERIRLSPWISICGDGSTDLGKQHNFVMDIRYLDPATNDVHTEFVKLSDCPGTARAMTKAFIRMLGEIAPDLILKLVGGSFDGANAMMGAKGGVQKQLKDYSPFAIFVHCVCHRAALLSRDAVAGDNESIASLHDALAKIYALFSRSGVRIDDLHQ
jgi:hypothetical protein